MSTSLFVSRIFNMRSLIDFSARDLEATLPAVVADQLLIVDDAPAISDSFADIGSCLQTLFDPVAQMNRIMETRAQQIELVSVDDQDLDSITVDVAADVLLMGKDWAGTPELKGVVS